MINPQEALLETRKYLKRLKSIIENQAKWTFLKTKVLDKSVIDDVLCCVEASLPDEYKEFAKKKGGRTLKSYAMLMELHASIKGRFLFSSASYLVRYREAIALIDNLPKSLNYDINRICNSSSDMF